MTPGQRETLINRQHLAVAVLSLWLVLTSPWVSMLRRIPSAAGFLDYAHVVLGFLTLMLAAAYSLSCASAGGWRLYFPWASGRLGAVARDLAGLRHGRVPSAEGGGIFAMIEGLLLLALLVTAATGAAWFLAQGEDAAIQWRACHVLAARGLVGLLALHVVAVASHLVDFAGY
jgi:hypothetical protein